MPSDEHVRHDQQEYKKTSILTEILMTDQNRCTSFHNSYFIFMNVRICFSEKKLKCVNEGLQETCHPMSKDEVFCFLSDLTQQ